ncbi:glutathione S-transferase family protein [Microbulbifer halophilus]|uniref:glutathione transferase n=1 Tax=Microbulbifer halophilus TaxID=453963 RepID=A0ABW5E917_9GAMM|nr:glutathione S-transferase family protein [Microbulbifer halophilus]MCW8125517.1 glutathione S-transferase family protein [Microbulbifer halophilus]
MDNSLTLVSHELCPYVQRAAITMMEKGLPFERLDIDLAHKPDWFLRLAPLAKTPVLLAGDRAIFESAVICEYLEDTAGPPLYPTDPLERAQQRSLVELASAILANIAGLYSATNGELFTEKATALRSQFETMESTLEAQPYFNGEAFGMVDAAFATAFRYFDVFDTIGEFGILQQLPKLQRWRAWLAARDSVARAVTADYPALLLDFLRRRDSHLAGLIPYQSAGTPSKDGAPA